MHDVFGGSFVRQQYADDEEEESDDEEEEEESSTTSSSSDDDGIDFLASEVTTEPAQVDVGHTTEVDHAGDKQVTALPLVVALLLHSLYPSISSTLVLN